MEFGARIRAIRQDRGLTQEELAHRAGMSLKSVYFIETGRSQDPHYSTLTSIASALGVDLVELLDSPKAEAPTSATSREVEDRRMTEPGAEDLVEYRTWARIVVDRLNNDRRKALSERENNRRKALSELYIMAASSAGGFSRLVPEDEDLDKTPEYVEAKQALREKVEELRLFVKTVEAELHELDDAELPVQKADNVLFLFGSRGEAA